MPTFCYVSSRSTTSATALTAQLRRGTRVTEVRERRGTNVVLNIALNCVQVPYAMDVWRALAYSGVNSA
jgi:hypothetical protein